jgi:Ca2+-binding RTX toxin-like protein
VRALRLAGLALALLAITPASALAAFASVVSSDGSGNLTYSGSSVANVVTITGSDGNPGAVVFTESGIAEGTDTANACTSTTDTVTCSNPQFRSVTVLGGAGADDLTVNGNVGASISGGTENDRVTGGDGGDSLDGGDGADQVFGRGGEDFFQPDTGDGDLIDMGLGNDSAFVVNGDGGGDTLRGGPGEDVFSYSWTGAPSAFAINLATGTLSHDGSPAEAPDALQDIEDVEANDFSGSTGNDSLIGSSGPNVLASGTGNDIVDGGPGTDRLLADTGQGLFGLFTSGSGSDIVRARDGFADQIACGPGVDNAEVDQFDPPLMDESCENVQQAQVPAFGITPAAAPDATAPRCKRSRLARQKRSRFLRNGFVVAYTCNESAKLALSAVVRVKRSRSGKVVLSRTGDLVVAERRLRFGTGKRRVRLKVARSVRRALGKRFKVTIRATATDHVGNQRTTSGSFAVR